jgi:CubicO group peptidase (beta-lactamase class C family)
MAGSAADGRSAAMGAKSPLEQFVDQTYKEMDDKRDIGLAIAVVTKDEVLLSKGYGYRVRKARDPLDVNPQTLFGIGSVTKPFTSLAVMMLIEKGMAGLGNPVRSYDSNYELFDPQATAEVSFEDILSQRTGVPRNDGLWYLGQVPLPQIYERLRYIVPDANPGMGFRNGFYYNNLLYSSAGVLIEKREKMKWSSFVKKHIFEPIGMTSTNTKLADLQKSGNMAAPYYENIPIPNKSMKNIAPAGAINSNAVDMAAWLQLFLGEGRLDSGKRLVSKDSMKQLRTRRVLDVKGFGEKCDYAMGWFVSKMKNDMDLVWCPGNADGYSAYASFMPTPGVGVVALVNQQTSDFGERIAAAIYEHMLAIPVLEADQEPRSAKHKIAAFQFPQEVPPASASPGSPPPKVGKYENSAYGKIQISKSGKDYSLTYGKVKYELVEHPHGGWGFKMGLGFQIPVVSYVDPAAGSVLRIPFEPTSGWLHFFEA